MFKQLFSSHLLSLAWYMARIKEHFVRIELTNNGLLAQLTNIHTMRGNHSQSLT